MAAVDCICVIAVDTALDTTRRSTRQFLDVLGGFGHLLGPKSLQTAEIQQHRVGIRAGYAITKLVIQQLMSLFNGCSVANGSLSVCRLAIAA